MTCKHPASCALVCPLVACVLIQMGVELRTCGTRTLVAFFGIRISKSSLRPAFLESRNIKEYLFEISTIYVRFACVCFLLFVSCDGPRRSCLNERLLHLRSRASSACALFFEGFCVSFLPSSLSASRFSPAALLDFSSGFLWLLTLEGEQQFSNFSS